jgi:CsoR family transcriptional regulator, copper-sensing transcriptional repressor
MKYLTQYPPGVYIDIMISDIKKRALHRTKILEGQMRGLQKMIEQEEYCMDILTQSLAVQKSLGSLNKLILENHIRTHVKEHLSSGSEKLKDQTIEELLGLYELGKVRGK